MDDEIYAFGSFRLIAAERVLLDDGMPVRLGSRALDILIALVEAAGETIPSDQLMARAWPTTTVDESSLRVQVSALRRALADGRGGRRWIATIPGRGYAFVAPVTHEHRGGQAPPPLGPPVIGGSLPRPLARVIGRDNVVASVAARLRRHRLLTIVGPGGIGKSTVAVAAAEAASASYADGVWFVGLGSLQDPSVMPSAVGSVLGSPPGVGDPLSSLIAWLRDKHALIVLDNCEHVIGAVAAFTEAVLKAAPRITILTTSREPLRAESESLLRLPPLEVPGERSGLTAAQALSFPAVELFNERVTSTVDSFALSDAEVPYVIEICHALDGMPLPIELAAVQVDVLGIRGLAARLDDRLAVLARGRRTAAPRQQTLRATLDWSYDLLSTAEQRLLCHLAVFVTGFTLEQAAAVAGVDKHALTDVVEGITGLVAKSLITRDGSSSPSRWLLPATIRIYALEKLADSGDAVTAARRHAEFFRDLIVPAGTVLRLSIEDVARFGREIDNVRAALDWCFSESGNSAIGVALTAAYAPVWLHMSLIAECRRRAEQALQILSPSVSPGAPLERRLHIALGIALTLTSGPVEQTKTVIAKSRELAESVDDIEAQLRALWAQWSMEDIIGERRATRSTAQRFLEIAERYGDPAINLVADGLVGSALLSAGRPREALGHLERVVTQYVAPANGRHKILFYYDQHLLARAKLARALWLLGLIDQAAEQTRISFEEAQNADPGSICWVLHYALCPVAFDTGDTLAAERSVAKMTDLATRLDAALWRNLGHFWNGRLLVERGELDQGSALLRTTLDACGQTGWQTGTTEFSGVLAQALMGLGQLDAALETVEGALARAQQSGERCDWPELLRVKGEIAERRAPEMAEDCLLAAIAAADEQESLSWQIRAALSLARLRAGQGRRLAAKQVLATVYARFSEGFDTVDLVAARTMIEQLP